MKGKRQDKGNFIEKIINGYPTYSLIFAAKVGFGDFWEAGHTSLPLLLETTVCVEVKLLSRNWIPRPNKGYCKGLETPNRWVSHRYNLWRVFVIGELFVLGDSLPDGKISNPYTFRVVPAYNGHLCDKWIPYKSSKPALNFRLVRSMKPLWWVMDLEMNCMVCGE